MYYHQSTRQCFELYKQGPCPDGHILSFNYGNLRPECKCRAGYHFYQGDGKCYLLNTRGNKTRLFVNLIKWVNELILNKYVDLRPTSILILGPCENEISECRGTPCFMKSLQELKVQCTCLPKRSMTDDGRCYEPYTRGPCR